MLSSTSTTFYSSIFTSNFSPHRSEERIHQFVRSLEALVLPPIGETERKFVHRCLTFVGSTSVHRQILAESYGMRNDAEHLHDWRRTFACYPESERETLALEQVRQIEQLSGGAYLKILRDPSLRAHFVSDSDIAEFWAKPDDERAKIWGSPIEI